MRTKIVILLIINLGIVSSFQCPDKRTARGGISEADKCGKRLFGLLEKACQDGITDKLIQNVKTNCLDKASSCFEQSERFLINSGKACAMSDSGQGVNMMVKQNICSKSNHEKVKKCALNEAKRHSQQLSNSAKMLPHLSAVCNNFADCIQDQVNSN